MPSLYLLRITLTKKTAADEVELTVRPTHVTGRYEISIKQNGSLETIQMNREDLTWYLDAFFQFVFMDSPKFKPAFIQIDLACMPSTIIPAEGSLFTIRVIREHVAKMLEIAERNGLPTMVGTGA
jgi:hypothetical protein